MRSVEEAESLVTCVPVFKGPYKEEVMSPRSPSGNNEEKLMKSFSQS